MKKFLLMLLLACGATAMANNTDPIQEKRVNAAVQQTAKENTKKSKADNSVVKPETVRYTGTTAQICSDNSRYGLGAYLVDIINRNNIKIMKKLLID